MSSSAYDDLANTLLPVINNQMEDSKEMWPNVKGLFVFTVTKNKKPATVWYLLLQGKRSTLFFRLLRSVWGSKWPNQMPVRELKLIFFCTHFLGKDIKPVITQKEDEAKAATKGKVRVVRIQVEDKDALQLITGG